MNSEYIRVRLESVTLFQKCQQETAVTVSYFQEWYQEAIALLGRRWKKPATCGLFLHLRIFDKIFINYRKL